MSTRRFSSDIGTVKEVLNTDGSHNDAENYKPGRLTTRKLIDEFNKKNTAASLSIKVPDLYSKNMMNADNVSIDYIDSNGITKPDLRSLAKAFYFYEKANDVERTLYLCNRLVEKSIVPHANTFGSIARTLMKADLHATEELYLNLLYTVNKYDIALNRRDFGAFVSRMRYIKDSFVLEAYKAYLLDFVRRADRSYNHFRLIIKRDYAVACLNNGNYEKAWLLYKDLPRNCGYPEHLLAASLTDSADGLKQAVDLCRDRTKSMTDMTWTVVLEQVCIQQDERGWKIIWEKYYKDKLHKLSTSNLDQAVAFAAKSHDLATMRTLLQELSLRGEYLRTSTCRNVITAHLKDSKDKSGPGESGIKYGRDWHEILQLLSVLLEAQPNLSYRDFPELSINLASTPENPYMLPQHLDTLLADFRDNARLCTFVMNLCLMGSYRSTLAKNTASILKLYNMMYRKGFPLDSETIEILSRIALRLKNSKILAYNVYKHAVDNEVKVTRLAFENMLKCQLCGSNYQSIFFFLIKMTELHVKLRKSYSETISTMFAKLGDNTFRDLQNSKGQQQFTQFLQTHSNFMNSEEIEKTDWNFASSESTTTTPPVRPYSYRADMWFVRQFTGGVNT